MNPDLKAEHQSLLGIAEQALRQAGEAGASQAEISLASSAGTSVGVRMGELETIEYNHDKSLSVSVYFGHQTGSASTTDLAAPAVREVVEAACDIARNTGVDEALGLADQELMATDVEDLGLDYPWDIEIDEMREKARACEQAALNFDQRIVNSEGANISTHRGLEVYANSHGFSGANCSTRHGYSTSVIAADNGKMYRDYWYSSERNHQLLESVQSVGRTAADRAVSRLGSRRIPTGGYPVVFDATVAPAFIGHLISAIRGGLLYKQASFLTNQLGKQIFPEHVNICEKPRLYAGMNSASYDNEGVSTPDERPIVEAGKLRGYVLGSYTARKLGMQTTANAGGVRNVRVSSGSLARNELLQQMNNGLLITECIGSGINMLTGDYSRGAAGYWVEGGEIQYPVEEVTIAGQLRDMFMGITAIASDSLDRGNIHCGSILLDKITIAGE